jgi:CheY-like chemotaxis protein
MPPKLLIIDDDPDDRGLFCEAIEEIAPDIVCYTAAGGQKAIAKLNDKEFDLPDIIFLDINMPAPNGWDCLLKLKAHEEYAAIPVIMFSTSSSPLDIRKAYGYGALTFFTKPSDFKDLKTGLAVVISSLRNNSLTSCQLTNSPWFATFVSTV